MNNMNIKSIIVSLFLLNICILNAKIQLPAKAMGKPEIFRNESSSYRWEEVAEKREWGKLSQEFWRVYIDRDGVIAREEPNSYSKSLKSLNFMDMSDALFVAEIQNGFALLYTEKEEQTNLNISKNAHAVGWVSVDNLLLWSHCLRTNNQVYRKAVILKDVDEYQRSSEVKNDDYTSPRFSESPYKMISTGYRAKDMEFYFVYKTVNGAALLFQDNKLENNVGIAKKGWMLKGFYTTWNERICFEPNHGQSMTDTKIGVFKGVDDAVKFRDGESVPKNNELWTSNCPIDRWPAKKTRFPVLNMYENAIANVGTICMLSDGKSGSFSANDIQIAKDKLDRLQRLRRQINVVFVIDGTKSMSNYYKPVANALVKYMKQISAKEANIYFGAVVYRNYADEKNNRLIEKFDLVKGGAGLSNWLVSRECSSIGQTHYEAMYYGLDFAIDNIKWNEDNCNFIILVGDAANDPNDRRFNANKIAEKMVKKGINLVAFQANHLNHPAYHKFTDQVQEIINIAWQRSSGKQMKREYNKYEDKTYLFKYENEDLFPIFVAGQRYADIDQSEDANKLQSLVEKRIEDFKEISDKNIIALQKVIDGGGDVDSEKYAPGVIKYLKSRGLSDSDIKNLMNGQLKIKGYTSRTSNDKDVFVCSVFFTKVELEELIKSLRSVTKDVSQNQRKELQDALKNLALTYIGQGKDYSEMSVLDIIQAVSGLTNVTSKSVLKGVDLMGITNQNRVQDREIKEIIDTLSKAADRLEKRKVDKQCYYDSPNGLRYYYILMEDMPLQGE